MRITVVEPFKEPRVIYSKAPKEKTLRDLLKNHPDADGVKSCTINGVWEDNWRDIPLTDNDDVCLYVSVGWQIVFLVIALILMIVSMVLAPRPQKPNQKKSQPALGMAGVGNTFASGTPKFFVLGIRRVFGHLIASRVDLIDNDKSMSFSAVYFMGTGPILAMRDPKIGDTNLADVAGPPVMNVRLGTDDQTVFTGHEYVHQVYYDGREIPLPASQFEEDPKVNDPIVYTTKGSDVDQASLFFYWPQGLQRVNDLGVLHNQRYKISIKYKLTTAPAIAYVDAPGSPITYTGKNSTLSNVQARFKRFEIIFPGTGQYDIRLFIEDLNTKYNSTGPMQLFNVQETRFIQTAYPGNSLMEIAGTANTQVTSFDELNGNCIICGKLVEVYDDTAQTYVIKFTRNRVWHVRHLLTSSVDGLGHRFNRSLWDDAAGINAARRYEELVQDVNGNFEQLDFCDVIVNEPKPGWDWIKILLSEGRAIIFPSAGKYKYVIDRELQSTMLYSYPGNIIQNTLKLEKGFAEKPINTLRADFPDVDHDYKVIPVELQLSTKLPTDPKRTDTISYASITRLSEIGREMDYRLKLAQLSRKWIWDSPGRVTISEPYDCVKLAYNTVDTHPGRGFVGFITEGSTADQLVLDREVYLTTGHTYSAFIRHNFDSEERTISSPIGITTSIISVSSPFSASPTMADNWIIGEQNLHVVDVKVQEIEFKNDHYTIKTTEKLANLYFDTETAVPVPGTSFPPIGGIVGGTSLVSSATCRPLIKVQAKPISSTVFQFNVVPGFDGIVGTYSSLIGTNTVVLDPKEPDCDDFFVNADIDLFGLGGAIFNTKGVAYIGASRQLTVRDSVAGLIGAQGQYEIDWPPYLTLAGFDVETSTTSSPSGTWTLIHTNFGGFLGDTITVVGTTNYFRFTPWSFNGNRNTVGRWIVAPGVTDTTAPAVALGLTISSTYSGTFSEGVFFADVIASLPVERDMRRFETNLFYGSPTGATIGTIYTDAYAFRSETFNYTPGFVLGINNGAPAIVPGITVGSVVYASVISEDFFGNRSAAVPASTPTVITDF